MASSRRSCLLSTSRGTRVGLGLDGDGGQRRGDPEGGTDHGGVVRNGVFQVHSVRSIQATGSSGVCLERSVGRALFLHHWVHVMVLKRREEGRERVHGVLIAIGVLKKPTGGPRLHAGGQ
jgi:hypothetical protein